MVAGTDGLVNVLAEVVRWLSDATRWSGTNGIPARLLEHIGYSIGATVIAMVIALPLAFWIGHTGRGGTLAVNVANVGRAIPTFGLILGAFVVFGLNLIPVYIALVLLAIPPILTNAYVGIREVDAEVREAAEGMGMTGAQVLARVEIPVAMPLIMTGIRTSAVQVVATATLAAFVGLGGLGRYLIDGLAQGVQFNVAARSMVIVGAALVALLAVLTEFLLDQLERIVVSSALHRERALGPAEPAESSNAPIVT
ncbi:MAG: ABC transporter permease subunit [Nitriliruptorales bacterium]|nr:ABC transporter permease subunit [Nitriliruptorales bacterium]